MAQKFIEKILQTAIRTYQLIIVPLLPAGSCRFHPTCSYYAKEAIDLHGPLKGCWLSLKRICSCNPWGKIGIDEVPPKKQRNLNTTEHITG